MNDRHSKSTTVTVIVPVLNEGASIRQTLQSIVEQDFAQEQLEVLLIDGGSTDGTCAILDYYSKKHAHMHKRHNEKGTAPYALNLGISQATGDIIMRMDCHSIYPRHYISTLVTQLHTLTAHNVGGVVKSMPPDDSCKSEAIATAMTSGYAVGNSAFRVGSTSVKQVDTVPFGCYPRHVFEDIGVFDTALTRNQDDEFNARLTHNGGRIFLIPCVEIQYHTRSTLTQLWRMFYQYGLFKPLVNQKCGKLSSYRQLAPPALVLLISLSLLATSLFEQGYVLLCTVLVTYLTFITAAALTSNVPSKRPISHLWLCICVPTIHLAYGLGYWRGLFGVFFARSSSFVKRSTR